MRRWVARFRASIGELSPEEAALLVAVGLVLGVFPLMGCPTALCLMAAAGLRLNIAALQLLNHAVTPLQIALILPLERAGACVCGGAPAVSVAGKIGLAGLHAVAGWACICVPASIILYFALIWGLRAGARRPAIRPLA